MARRPLARPSPGRGAGLLAGLALGLAAVPLAVPALAEVRPATAPSRMPLPLQAAAERALGARPGAVVALDPRDGRLLALVHPGTAVREAFPVGSLAKVVTAMAAVEAGVTDGVRTVECRNRFGPGTASVAHGSAAGVTFACGHVHGRVDLEAALARSCSAYFATVGSELGGAHLAAAFRAAGFGRVTGSGFPGEAPGLVETPRDPAAVAALAFGGSPRLRATPLQVACLVAAIARGGDQLAPHLGPGPGRRLGRLPWPRGEEAVLPGMRACALAGTGREANGGAPAAGLLGKTGTAPHPDDPGRRYGWFAGFTRHLAVVAFVRDGTGAGAAAPVVGRLLARAGSWARP